MNKKKIYDFAKKYLNSNNVRMFLLFIPLLIVIINQIKAKTFVIKDFYDSSILVSFIIVFMCETIANVILNVIEKKTEDEVKLGRDYKSLVNKYCVEKDKMVYWEDGGNKVYIPEIVLYESDIYSDNTRIEVGRDEEHRKYQLPKQLADNSEKIFKAHSHSTTYNQINIRLNNLIVNGNSVKIVYAMTTYYDSLLTNRAMDYVFKSGRTVREIYEPGPYLNELTDSKLSNHLGFNGFVELDDGNIIFVKRGDKVSIAKGLWQQSIGASLKTKYCVDSSHKLSIQGIENAVCNEIKDELKIDSISCKPVIFSFYRDLVEGGKPQFLFYTKTDKYRRDSFLKHFNEVSAKKEEKKENKNKLISDGNEFVFYTLDELRKCRFDVDKMVDRNGKIYNMMPSSVGSIILLLKHIK